MNGTPPIPPSDEHLEDIFREGSENDGPRPDWMVRIALIERPTTEEEYLINRRALSVALKEMARRREAGESLRIEDRMAEMQYLVSAIGYLDPVTFDVLEPKAEKE